MEGSSIIVHEQNTFLEPAATIAKLRERYQIFNQFVQDTLKKDVDYQVIPGTNKPSLVKPGAEKLSALFGLSARFIAANQTEDWTGETHNGEPFFYYQYRCELYRGDLFVASCDGSCNSWEKKYRYRESKRVCPVCKQPAIIKGKEEYGGGWLCHKKQGGCGAKFKDGDPAIEGQVSGLVPNTDIADQVNTLQKMAQKRAFVGAVLIATNASEYFTQDIEDMPGFGGDVVDGQFTQPAEPKPATQPLAQTGPEQHGAPKAKNGSRPFEPDFLKVYLSRRADEYQNKTASDKQRQFLPILLNDIFQDDAKRKTFQLFATGQASSKDIPDGMILALLDWLNAKADSGGMYIPDAMAVKEAQAAYTEALKVEGQAELPI